MKADYWADFWCRYSKTARYADSQTQVLRTYAKEPIDNERWELTVEFVQKNMHLVGSHNILDLCCGNGLLTRRLAPQASQILAVDISLDLLRKIEALGIENVQTLTSDIRMLKFAKNKFDRILFYAAIQYLTPEEVVPLFQRMASWLEPGGILYIGDVPDSTRIWNFFNSPERREKYFDNIKSGEPVVGTWFDPSWLMHLGFYAGFSDVAILDQPEFMIYSNFRYDVVLTR